MLNTPRYGRKIRNKYKKMHEAKSKTHICPKCGKKKLKRISFALWMCKSCGAIIAGGAYTPTTEAGEVAKRLVSSQEE